MESGARPPLGARGGSSCPDQMITRGCGRSAPLVLTATSVRTSGHHPAAPTAVSTLACLSQEASVRLIGSLPAGQPSPDFV